MLWIFLVLFLIILFFGAFEKDCAVIATGIFPSLVLIFIIFGMLASYNQTKTSAKKEIAVLEEYNKELIEQIEPVVNKYLDHESTIFLKSKPEANTLIALSAYPELKGNEFVQQQIKVIINNNEQIKNRKLNLASLNPYKLW